MCEVCGTAAAGDSGGAGSNPSDDEFFVARMTMEEVATTLRTQQKIMYKVGYCSVTRHCR